ncbi:aspartate 1-decarboxylase [Nonomuraea jabiensis]|uniref:aspartate 1-decarboxylase n=1 Tax=Nonomuraea jabiensis TaxID=882448 RepID=UPI003D72BC4A
MFREMLKSKIHRARVTQADLHYVGSLTVDRDLLIAANLLSGEKIDVVNINNGSRFTTYIIEGPAGSGVIGVNGAAARLVSPGDIVIVIAYATVPEERAEAFRPVVVFVDECNRPVQVGTDAADAFTAAGLVRGDIPAG